MTGVVISGCSGGGKSTLVEALAARGHAVIPEPGRRIVRAALDGRGGALPWEAPERFAAECISVAAADLEGLAGMADPVFLDRSGLDAVIWLQSRGLAVPEEAEAVLAHRFARVFLAPPWPGLRSTDAERRGSMVEAEAEYRDLKAWYPKLGYEVTLLPKVSVDGRIDFLSRALGLDLAAGKLPGDGSNRG